MSGIPIRAAVSRDSGSDLHLEEIYLTDPGPGEVRVRIAAATICGSDLAYIDGEWQSRLGALVIVGMPPIGVTAGLDTRTGTPIMLLSTIHYPLSTIHYPLSHVVAEATLIGACIQ